MRKLILVFAIIAISMVSVAPVLAKGFDLLIHNNTEDSIKIVLKGKKKYTFTVEPGKFAKAVDEGTYTYNYIACDGDVDASGKISVNKAGVWLIIDPCPSHIVLTKFVVNSHIHESLALELVGPEKYKMTIGLGKNKFIDIVAGWYSYSHDYCDEVIGGTIRITKNGKTRLKLHGCERQEILDFGLPNPRNLRIGSHFAFPITVTLIGPKQYYLTVNPGFNRIDVIKGTYTYIFTAYNKNYSGVINVTGGGVHNTVILSPLDPIP